jgi:hypothetical protein
MKVIWYKQSGEGSSKVQIKNLWRLAELPLPAFKNKLILLRLFANFLFAIFIIHGAELYIKLLFY